MLLDEILPDYHFNEVHSTIVQAAPDRIFRAIKESTPADIPLMRTLFWIRSLPARLTGQRYNTLTDEPLLDQSSSFAERWLMLAEARNQEVVFGIIYQPWKLSGGEVYRVANPDHFLRFDRPGYVKIAANFHLGESEGTPGLEVRTETRIYATDPTVRRKFALYWRLIYPGSALLRRMWLKSIKQRTEQV